MENLYTILTYFERREIKHTSFTSNFLHFSLPKTQFIVEGIHR